MGGLSHTVSGDIASFRTPSRVPIESLKFHFLPKQEGSGDPSPINVRPITGWTGLNGLQLCKNLIQFTEKTSESYGLKWIEYSDGVVEYEGTPTSWSSIVLGTVKLNGITKVYGKIFGDESNVSFNTLYIYDANGTRLGQISAPWENTTHDDTYVTVDLSSYPTADHIDIRLKRANNNIPMKGKCYAVVTDNLDYLRIPITFPVAGTNKIDPSTIVPETRISVSDGVYSNTGIDTRTFVQLQVQLWKTTGTYIKSVAVLNNITTAGRKSLTFNVDTEDCHYIAFKHNGIVADFRVIMPFNLGLGTYTLSVDLLSADPTTVGGFRFKDVQLEVGDTAHAYEPYSSDNTFYGGYIDPIAGEIVAEYVSKIVDGSETGWNTNSTSGSNTRFHISPSGLGLPKPVNSSTSLAKFSYFNSSSSPSSWNGFIGSTGNALFFVPTGIASTVDEWKEYLSEHPLQICYKLAEPIHIPISPQDIKAFLDHNNFWSDANDITEVTYAVTESKDILATRKKAVDFDMGHRRKVRWNQWAPAVTGDKYAPYNSNKISVSVEDGIITQTFLAVDYTYRASVTTPSSMKRHALNRYYYLSYEYCADFDGGNIGGSVGGQYVSATFVTQANVWARFRGVVKRTETGNFDNYIVYLGQFSNSNGISIGSTCQMRNPIAIDLTQMFGAGNEPNTASKFERICELNGIDLTNYHPCDTGSDRWLIVP